MKDPVRLCLNILVIFLCACLCVNGLSDKDDQPLIESCHQQSPCSCKSPKFGLIDLSPLGKTDGTPMFHDVETGIQQYSWNPCYPFTQKQCVNVAMCQRLTFQSSTSYPLGTQDSAHFIINDKGFQLSYSSDSFKHPNVSTSFVRTSYIKLVCDLTQKPGVFVAEGEDMSRPGHYYFTLTSFHACPAELKPYSKSSISPGSCLLIICGVFVLLYLSVGIALQLFAFKRTGTDVIPNKSLWVALPGLVKEGCQFVQRRGKTPGYVEM